jgi:hemerythrin-like domain-containing protein
MEESMGHSAVNIIRSEHRSIAAVLHGLLYFARRLADGQAVPDYKVLRAMLYYLDAFPERSHHPKENRYLFAKLRSRTSDAEDIISRLEDDHIRGEHKIRALMRAIIWVECGGSAYYKEFAMMVEEYAQFHWRHMGLEEDIIMPLAERTLTEEDWSQIDAAFSGNVDPLVGIENFEELFTRIVTLAPPPIGVGPELSTPE